MIGIWAGFIAVAFAAGAILRAMGALPVDALPPLHAHARLPPAGLLPAVVVAVVGVALLPRLSRLPWRVTLGAAWLGSAVWAVALQLPDGVARPLTAPTEYLAGLPAMGDDPLGWLRGFTRHLQEYPTHVKGHPPLPMLILWTMQWTGLRGADWAAALVIAAGSSATIAIAVTVRVVAGEVAARRAIPFVALAPTAIWVATSMDALFLGTAAWAVALLALACGRAGGVEAHPPWGTIPIRLSRAVDFGSKRFHRLWITSSAAVGDGAASGTGAASKSGVVAASASVGATGAPARTSAGGETEAGAGEAPEIMARVSATIGAVSGTVAGAAAGAGAETGAAAGIVARTAEAGAVLETVARASVGVLPTGTGSAGSVVRDGRGVVAPTGVRRHVLAFSAGVLLGALPYLSYGLLSIFALPLAVLLLTRPRRSLIVALVAGCLVVPGAFVVGGFSWFDGMAATHAAWAAGAGSRRPYAYFLIANIAVLALVVGPVITKAHKAPVNLKILMAAAFLGVLALDLSGVTRGEVERIWLPYAAWMTVGAAARPTRRLLVAQVGTALLIQAFVRSPW